MFSDLPNGYGRGCICWMNSSTPYTWAIWIHSSKDITSAMSTVLGLSWSWVFSSPFSFTMIYLFIFLLFLHMHGTDLWNKWDMMTTTTPASQRVKLSSATNSRICYVFFLFTNLVHFRNFHLPFRTKIILKPLTKESMWRFWQLLWMFISRIHSRAWKMTTKWVHGPSEKLWDKPWPGLHLFSDPIISLSAKIL